MMIFPPLLLCKNNNCGKFVASLMLSTSLLSYAFSQEQAPLQVPLIIPQTGSETQETIGETAPKIQITDENRISRIIIIGALRIDERTILERLSFKPGDPYTASIADASVKQLFATGLFANINIAYENNDVSVTVQENPVINQVAFEGNERIDDVILQAEVGLTQRTVYSRSKVQLATQRILDIYRRRGRYAATVEPQIIQREQNRIDLVFEIDEGQLSKIQKIFFNGNRYFSDGDLRDVISSRQYNSWNFLATGDTYDPDRVEYDKQLLQNYYRDFGFIDYRLASAVGELLEDRSGFYITFAVQEGSRYRIGDVSVTSAIPEISADEVLQEINFSGGDWYDQNEINKLRVKISNYLGNLGYAFTDIRINLDRQPSQPSPPSPPSPPSNNEADNEPQDRPQDRIVNLQFAISESPRVYVERIDIAGNVRTIDSVIRREFDLVEGDPYNSNKINLARRNLQRLGYFSNVTLNQRQGSAADKSVIDVEVSEKSTGSINLGVGFSTVDGTLFSISLKENNLLGRAHEFVLSYTDSKRSSEFLIGYSRPYFLGYDVRAGVQAFRSETEQSNNNFKSEELGARLTASYPLAPYLSQFLYYKIADQENSGTTTTNNTTSTRDNQNGILSEIGQSLTYDRRTGSGTIASGYYLTLSNNLAGLGGEFHYLQTILRGAYYAPLGRSDWSAVIGAEAGNISGWNNDKIGRGQRFFLGGRNLRGFKNYGAGSRSQRTNGFALGGTNIATATAELRRPILPESFGMTASVFTDWGWMSGIEDDAQIYDNLVEDSNIRGSIGTGIGVRTPIGPMRFDFAWPIKKETYDIDEVFQFSFSGRF